MRRSAMVGVLMGIAVAGQGAAQQPMGAMPGMEMGTKAVPQAQGPAAEFRSLTVPVQEMQEPEAVELRTGGDLPAPELLGDVVRRAPMSLAMFVEMAEKNNPTLRQAQDSVDRSRGQAVQAGLAPDPVVGYSGEHIRGGSYHGGEEGAFFSQEIVLGWKLKLRREVYRAEGRTNELAVAVQRARVHSDVTRGFFDALAAQATVVVEDRLLKVAMDQETNAHELERVGQADAGDVLKAEVTAEQAKVDFAEAQRIFLAAFSRLAAYAGQGALPPAPLTGSLAEPPQMDTHELVAQAVASSPAVQQAQASVEAEEARLRSARRESVPDLQVKAGEWYSGEALDGTGRRAGWMSFAEAGVRLPLWNRNQGDVDASRALVDRARQEVKRTQLWTKTRAEPLAQEYEQARFTVNRYRTEMLPRARRAYELEVMKYQQMAQVYPQVTAAQQMLFTLQLGYIRALHAEWSAAVLLQNATLEGALEQPTSAGSYGTGRGLAGHRGGE